jgi:hypothetical protein
MMNLRSFYLGLSVEQRTEFCRKAGTTPGYVQQVYLGNARPSWRWAKKVADASGGKLTQEVIAPHIFGTGPKRRRGNGAAVQDG